MPSKKNCLAFVSLVLVYVGVSAFAAPTGKKVLTLEDYPRWKHIVSANLSSDGGWMSYGLRPNGGDETLYIKSLTADKVYEIACGSRLVFSEDGSWAAYMIDLPKKEADKLRKERKPVVRKAELLNLLTGEKYPVDNASSFVFSEDSKFFALSKEKADRRARHKGVDLLLRNLQTGSDLNMRNVSEFEFNNLSTLLAYTVDTIDKKDNGIYLMELDSGVLNPLDTGEADYERLAWDKEGTALAVLKGTKKEDMVEKDNMILAFAGLGSGRLTKLEIAPAAYSSFPQDMVISERMIREARRRMRRAEVPESDCLFWSEDGSKIFCGIKEQERELEKSEEPVANVDVWHWKDERIQSLQMVQAEADRNFTHRSVFNLDSKRFARLTDEKMRTITISRDGKWGIGKDDKPYLSDVETLQADYYLVNTATGERKLIAQGIRHPLGLSPDSKHFLYLKDKQLWLYEIEQGKTVNLSERAPVSFVNEEDDHPAEKPAYGVAGWTKDGRAVIVNHRFDLWGLPFDGTKPTNLTAGMGEREQIRFRYVRLHPEERFIDTSKPMLLSARGEWTKKSGYYSLKVGTEPRKLIYEDKQIGFPIKAKNADIIIYTMESFVDFPDYYLSKTDFKEPKRVTEANPQQSEYAWGSRTLIDYQNSKGQRLQATLTLPAGYEKGKRYPMLVFIYEKLSQRHHEYSMPIYDDRPHFSTYASDGYLVLLPDIVYTIGRPGDSALDCVSSAVEKVIDLGYADPDRIGLQGHSFGGYESAFIITQTDMFACVVAGAAPTDPATQYISISKGFGFNPQFYYERTQGRMGTDPWKDAELYFSQSPIRQAEKITTPFMLLHGIEDGHVDWNRALNYYNAARRLGKKVILLSYPGEPHHLTREENQKDFLTRMKQYFDHYLKGSPAPDWMENGVPYLKKKRKLEASGVKN